MNKVVLIGCGNVGMSYAYALVNQQTYVDELCLIDLDMENSKANVSIDLFGQETTVEVELSQIESSK